MPAPLPPQLFAGHSVPIILLSDDPMINYRAIRQTQNKIIIIIIGEY